MRTLHLAGILVWGIGLSGCGPSLGNYEVMEIAVVEKLPETLRLDRGPEPFLKLSIRSNFDLVADAMNVYAFKTSCSWPYAEDRMIHGPLAAADPPIDLYDAEPAMKRDAQGKASYVLYLPVAAPAQLHRQKRRRTKEAPPHTGVSHALPRQPQPRRRARPSWPNSREARRSGTSTRTPPA